MFIGYMVLNIKACHDGVRVRVRELKFINKTAIQRRKKAKKQTVIP